MMSSLHAFPLSLEAPLDLRLRLHLLDSHLITGLLGSAQEHTVHRHVPTLRAALTH